MRLRHACVVTIVGLWWSAAVHAAATPPSDAPPPTGERPGLQRIDNIRFEDHQGNVLTPEQFRALTGSGAEFAMAGKNADGATIIRMKAPAAAGSTPGRMAVGDAMPAFDGTLLDGVRIDRAALLGKPTLLSFFFAQCAPCIEEIPALNAFAQQAPDLRLLAVTFDTADVARDFVAKHGLRWDVLPDAQTTIDAVGVRVYPTLMLLDADARVLARVVELGADTPTPLTAAQLRDWVDAASKGSPAAAPR